jgi:anion-transporting  ArsA/GET3 family ATPase
MAMRMARAGPLHAKAERMWQLVADPVRTAFNIVTLPEEMSVAEAIDLHRASAEMGLPQGKVIVNGLYPDFFAGDGATLSQARARSGAAADLSGQIARAALDAAASSITRRQAHKAMMAKLADGLPLERIALPLLFPSRIGYGELATLADGLDGL